MKAAAEAWEFALHQAARKEYFERGRAALMRLREARKAKMKAKKQARRKNR
jgi:hypothetical protein